jgi:selenocysteine lyase/cysteine desulfurase
LNVVKAQQQLKTLMTPLLEWAIRQGYSLTNDVYHLIGIRPSDLSTDEMIAIAEKLEQQGIYIAVRCGVFRVSAYLDNTQTDVDRLIEALNREITCFRSKRVS